MRVRVCIDDPISRRSIIHLVCMHVYTASFPSCAITDTGCLRSLPRSLISLLCRRVAVTYNAVILLLFGVEYSLQLSSSSLDLFPT